ncbi:MAG: UvrB/UvrC motif-containing protein [Planctomycetales bacterium]|nr:UvrB/UvrC motif-containing protein [Planctomycetales bacterium]
MPILLCQTCQKRQAVVHLTEIDGNVKREVHLCDQCSNQAGFSPKVPISVSNLLATLLAQTTGREGGEHADLKCPTCGTTYAEFRARGRFGCPDDYVAFQKGIGGLLEKIHGGGKHAGKSPGSVAAAPAASAAPAAAPAPAPAPKAPDRSAKRRELQAALEKAVASEEYERAAEIRDQLRSLDEDRGSE